VRDLSFFFCQRELTFVADICKHTMVRILSLTARFFKVRSPPNLPYQITKVLTFTSTRWCVFCRPPARSSEVSFFPNLPCQTTKVLTFENFAQRTMVRVLPPARRDPTAVCIYICVFISNLHTSMYKQDKDVYVHIYTQTENHCCLIWVSEGVCMNRS